MQHLCRYISIQTLTLSLTLLHIPLFLRISLNDTRFLHILFNKSLLLAQMHPASIALFALAVTPISAVDASPRAGTCPAVWQTIAADLTNIFQGCNKAAHSAVRAVLHACLRLGCNGSLILSQEECSRVENLGLRDLCKTLNQKRTQYRVGAADMVQFAGAMSLSACPLGPQVQALVGRRDSSADAPPTGLPRSRDPVQKILSMFAAKGFSPQDVVALLGTHSIVIQV